MHNMNNVNHWVGVRVGSTPSRDLWEKIQNYEKHLEKKLPMAQKANKKRTKREQKAKKKMVLHLV